MKIERVERGAIDVDEEFLIYNTRDGKGNDIIKKVELKKYKKHTVDFTCPICGRDFSEGVKTGDVVSAKFTDWVYLDDYICADCANLFSLYFYSYIINDTGIHLYNIRELKEQLCTKQTIPFLFAISTSGKKHLFYKSRWNYADGAFFVNLEEEPILTNNARMIELFDFVECLQTLGASKEMLKEGSIPFNVLQKLDKSVLSKLQAELKHSREIQIPLYCGQKRAITEEECICCINSILKA